MEAVNHLVVGLFFKTTTLSSRYSIDLLKCRYNLPTLFEHRQLSSSLILSQTHLAQGGRLGKLLFLFGRFKVYIKNSVDFE